MRITLKVICGELLNGLPSGEYVLPGPEGGEGYSVTRTIELCAAAAYEKADSSGFVQAALTEAQLSRPMYVLNGKNVRLTDQVKDGDILMAVRPVIGG